MQKEPPPNSSRTPVPQETGPQLENPLAKRALKTEGYEMAAVFFTSMPPREAKKWVDEGRGIAHWVRKLHISNVRDGRGATQCLCGLKETVFWKNF